MITPFRVSVLVLSASFASPGHAQTLQPRPQTPPVSASQSDKASQIKVQAPVLSAGTSLQVELPRSLPMKKGEPVAATLLYPLYVDGRMVLPKGTPVHGEVTYLNPDRSMRNHARLHGDFTPFHQPEVRFDDLVLSNGSKLTIDAPVISNGAPVLELSTPGVQPHRSIFARGWSEAKTRARQPIDFFIQPGFGDRAKQVLYHQLPYHPEQIPAHTAWTFELAHPLTLPDENLAASNQPNPAWPAASSAASEVWSVHALLKDPISSATSKVGEPVKALVVEPVVDRNRQIVVPQGSMLIGRVSVAKPAQSLGRNGKLRFTFQQIQFPQGANRSVESSLAGATTDQRQDLSIDAEGTITPKSKASVVVPLALTFLAGRALDDDGNQTFQAGVASNGFGIIGRIVGTAAGSRELAAGIGYYAAALSIYENWLTPGRDVTFPLDTRIEIQTSPLRAPVLKSANTSN
ncbi:hypothetical protein [Acidisarcina polymorpha]|nr:hypothetical protein [Acidisarcina polymorpha]